MPAIALMIFLFLKPAAAEWTVRPAAPERVSLLVGYATTLTAFGLRHPFEDELQTYEARHRPLGHLHTVGDYAGRMVPNALYAGVSLLMSGRDRAFVRAQLMIVATLEAAAISTALKYLATETRPNGSDHLSFPSGHATTAFAFASLITAEHGWAWGVPAIALASLTGWSRINDNMHYLHDVLAGATIGTTFALGVWLKHSRGRFAKVGVVPRPIPGGGELHANFQF